jgi:RNA polymerase sigma-70 factor, ECF subfamily
MTVVPAEPAKGIPHETGAGMSTNAAERVINAETRSGFPDEDELVLAARTDRQAFGVLYDRYFDAIYHYIARRVGDTETAEDLASAVWEKALIAIQRYEVRGVPFAAWLYRIAGNLVANHHRQGLLRRVLPLLKTHGSDTPMERLDEQSAVRAAFRALSAADQEVLSLSYFAGLEPPEIAAVQGCSVAAVHKRLARARARLRDELEGDAGHGHTPTA